MKDVTPTIPSEFVPTLLRVAAAGLADEQPRYWWPASDDHAAYPGMWVPMVGESRDGSRQPEPLTDLDRAALAWLRWAISASDSGSSE